MLRARVLRLYACSAVCSAWGERQLQLCNRYEAGLGGVTGLTREG